MSGGLLERMAAASARRVAHARAVRSESELLRHAQDAPPPSRPLLAPHGFDLIAEIKRRAPSAGDLAPGTGDPSFVAGRARAYVEAGAAAVSVLTEPEAFGGSLSDLEQAARAAPVPVMRKDFLVDPYQLVETRAAGASGALLILRILDDARLLEMLHAARNLDLFVLLEAFDGEDLRRAGALAGLGVLEGVLVGLNSRNLSTLEVDRARLAELASAFPPDVTRVAESGTRTARHAREVAALGYRMALVGTALMRAGDPAALVRALLAAGRLEAARSCA